jgi:hypothetical protein
MENKKNRYEERKKGLLHGITNSLDTKGNIQHSAVETLKDVVIGVVGGGLAGAICGRASLPVGALVTGVGHYMGNRMATAFGIGIMASAINIKEKGVSGNEEQGIMDGINERVDSFKTQLSQKFFLDKFLKKTSAKPETTNGVGEVEYYASSASAVNELQGSELDLSALENLERQIAESGNQYAKQQMKGIEDEMGELDPTDTNF